MHEFEPFETTKFVSRLLGRGDWGGFIDKVKDVIPEVRTALLHGTVFEEVHIAVCKLATSTKCRA